jgi:hypothetical protein
MEDRNALDGRCQYLVHPSRSNGEAERATE